MSFALRKNRPGRYWKGRMNSGTALAETSEKDTHLPEAEMIAIYEPDASDDPIDELIASVGVNAIEDELVTELPTAPLATDELEAKHMLVASDRAVLDEPQVVEVEAKSADHSVADVGAVAAGEPTQPVEEGRSPEAEANEPTAANAPLPPRPRAVGAPLPRGAASRPASFEIPLPPPSQPRALQRPAVRPEPQEQHPSGAQRAAKVFRAAVPFVQRLLPLLEGNLVGAVTNILAPPQHKPAPPVDLAPVQDSLTQLLYQHRELRDQVSEQHSTIKRVEDQLERVREATDRNTLEQQELMEDLRAVGFKANVVALVALALLLVSLFLSLFLYLHFQRVFP